MTKVKGRLSEWIEAKVRALTAPASPLPLSVEKAPPHIRIAERVNAPIDRHARARRTTDVRGHRSSRAR